MEIEGASPDERWKFAHEATGEHFLLPEPTRDCCGCCDKTPQSQGQPAA